MTTLASASLAPILESIVQELDISASKYKEAVERYEAVGTWLDAQDSPLRKYSPQIYPQGSFRLGTVVRPVSAGKEADYDIDLVCQLGMSKSGTSPKALKHLVGDRLKSHGTYRKMLDDEGRRCWTLEYAEQDGIGFHLDVLPSIPADPSAITLLEFAGAPEQYRQSAIEITERATDTVYAWVRGGSNPLGYALWFDSVNASARSGVVLSQKRMLFEANRQIYASVDEVPDALLRTPLQRAIQVLKRHRDVRFSGHKFESEKPISMIITTLAALAYQGESDLASTLESILAQIADFASSGIIKKHDGKWTIPNPVNPNENFADRWNEPGSHRADAFFEWVSWVQQDMALAAQKSFPDDSRAILAEALGTSGTSKALDRVSGAMITQTSENVPSIGNQSHRQSPPWPLRLRHQVSVTGQVRPSPQSSKNLWTLTSRPVPKGFGLRFRAATDVPPPFDVKWQIINTGTEAASAGQHQLRGGFDDGEGPNGMVRVEGTAYRGTHSIEAFVIKHGECLARSGPILVRVK